MTEPFSNIGSPQGGIRVLTLNLAARNGKWPERRSVLIKGIKALQPDLMAFQEVIKNGEYDQVTDLLGMGYYITHQKNRTADGMGISIASRWPLGDVKELDLQVTPRTANFPAAALIAEVYTPDAGTLLFVNHFPNWQLNFEYERELQTVKTARFIEQYIEKNKLQVILVGDMDADPEASSIRFLSGRQSMDSTSVCYRDAWESIHSDEAGHTFTPVNTFVSEQVIKGTKPFRDWPFRRIDYIFVRFGEHGGPALDIIACERIFYKPLNHVWASDHFGLVADLAASKFIEPI